MRLPHVSRRQGTAAVLGTTLLLLGGIAFAAQVAGDHPPSRTHAGGDLLAECTSPAGATVTLDATGSTIAPGDEVLAYEWRLGDGPDARVLGQGETLDATLPLGTHNVTLVVTLDRLVHETNATQENETAANETPAENASTAPMPTPWGAPGATQPNATSETNATTRRGTLTDTLVVEVVDTTPPLLHAAPSLPALWPPNHKLVPVDVEVVVEDACSERTSWTLAAATSNEPADGRGDGRTSPDLLDADIGTQDTTFLVRAERAGPGDGRAYTFTYEATDAQGLTTTLDVVVAVPHDMGD